MNKQERKELQRIRNDIQYLTNDYVDWKIIKERLLKPIQDIDRLLGEEKL